MGGPWLRAVWSSEACCCFKKEGPYITIILAIALVNYKVVKTFQRKKNPSTTFDTLFPHFFVSEFFTVFMIFHSPRHGSVFVHLVDSEKNVFVNVLFRTCCYCIVRRFLIGAKLSPIITSFWRRRRRRIRNRSFDPPQAKASVGPHSFVAFVVTQWLSIFVGSTSFSHFQKVYV